MSLRFFCLRTLFRMATNYNTKYWRKRFKYFKRRGGRGARKGLPRPAYNAFTVAHETSIPFPHFTAALKNKISRTSHCRRRFDFQTKNVKTLKVGGGQNYYSHASEERAYKRTIDRFIADDNFAVFFYMRIRSKFEKF